MKFRTYFHAGLLCSFLFGAAAASAVDVRFDLGNYVISGTSVTLSMSDLQNYSNTDSGSLRMELWAFTSPFTAQNGTVLSGYRLAVSPSLGTINGSTRFRQTPVSQTVPLVSPPVGNYYLALFLTEYQAGISDDGYVTDFNMTFPTTQSFQGGGAAYGISSAINLGSGFYYDTDLRYFAPLGNGVIYLSDLNRYYYLDPGTDFVTGTYIYDFLRSTWTYTEKSIWPYVYYFDGTGFVATGFN